MKKPPQFFIVLSETHSFIVLDCTRVNSQLLRLDKLFLGMLLRADWSVWNSQGENQPQSLASS